MCGGAGQRTYKAEAEIATCGRRCLESWLGCRLYCHPATLYCTVQHSTHCTHPPPSPAHLRWILSPWSRLHPATAPPVPKLCALMGNTNRKCKRYHLLDLRKRGNIIFGTTRQFLSHFHTREQRNWQYRLFMLGG